MLWGGWRGSQAWSLIGSVGAWCGRPDEGGGIGGFGSAIWANQGELRGCGAREVVHYVATRARLKIEGVERVRAGTLSSVK